MQEIYNIPIMYKEGVYGIDVLKDAGEEVLMLHYSDYGDIVTYELPECEYGGEIRLYGIPKSVLDATLQATYDTNKHLKMLTVKKGDKDLVLYMHYEDVEEAKQVVKDFAEENAKVILEKIALCKEPVSRLFVEYFNDGEYMDFHAKIGTETEKQFLEKKYPQYEDIGDSCGDYSAEILAGDNNKLAILVSCADNEEEDYFRFAVDIMVQIVEEEGTALLNKAADFRFMCEEYD